MKKKKARALTEVNASSMADIAFLLLIFFLVTTTIASDKGLAVLLPPKKQAQTEVKMKERNVYNVLINSRDMLLVEEQIARIEDLRPGVKRFITNKGVDPDLSETPKDAVLSLKCDRGTSYKVYVRVLDEIKKGYNEARAESVGMTLEQFNDLDPKNPDHKATMDRAKEAIPYQVSDAEPTDISGN